jgi:arylsulfatase A-like enzyme
MDRPNIVFIMADDMGYGDLGCYGATKIPTPHIDRLADDGMLFTDAHAASAVCTPSRYSVLTGRYCWRSRRKRGVGGGFSLPLIDPARTTVASLLKSHGYVTGAIGKWHVGLEWGLQDDDVRQDQGRVDYFDPYRFDSERVLEDPGCIDYEQPITGGPTDLGFDYFFGIAGSLDMPPYCFIENDRTMGIPCVEKEPYHPQQHKGLMTPGWKDEEVDVRFAERAVAFIERCHAESPSQPFFLYLTPSAPHRPCIPPAFLEGSSQAGPRGDMVAVVDWVVSQVMETLERLGLADDTLVIVTSDNGAQLADVDGKTYGHKSCGDLRGRKADIWDGGHRVPFIARWPGHIARGSTSDAVLCLSDLLATCAALVGEPLPIHAGEDSISLLPLLFEGARADAARRAIIHHSVFGMFALRQSRWKLIFGRGSGGNTEPRTVEPAPGEPLGQLYDMVADLSETDNVWLDRPDIVDHLTALFEQYRRQGHSQT